jgi:hypothetical protein
VAVSVSLLNHVGRQEEKTLQRDEGADCGGRHKCPHLPHAATPPRREFMRVVCEMAGWASGEGERCLLLSAPLIETATVHPV